jgi:enoyl-CoA hydratase/carnithine racemase
MGVTVEVSGNAAVVTMSWPQRRNALGMTEAEEVAAAIESASALDASAVVLRGDGAFCAGGDLPAIVAATQQASDADVERLVYGRFQQIPRALRGCPLPTVAAIDGAAVGLGLDIALWCDRIFFGAGAKLSQGWARMGLIPGTGGAALLQARAPGLLWKLLGEPSGRLSVADAELAGLGTRVEVAYEAALEYVDQLALYGRDALRGYVELSREHLPGDNYLRACARIQSKRLTSQDFADRVSHSGLTERKADRATSLCAGSERSSPPDARCESRSPAPRLVASASRPSRHHEIR